MIVHMFLLPDRSVGLLAVLLQSFADWTVAAAVVAVAVGFDFETVLLLQEHDCFGLLCHGLCLGRRDCVLLWTSPDIAVEGLAVHTPAKFLWPLDLDHNCLGLHFSFLELCCLHQRFLPVELLRRLPAFLLPTLSACRRPVLHSIWDLLSASSKINPSV